MPDRAISAIVLVEQYAFRIQKTYFGYLRICRSVHNVCGYSVHTGFYQGQIRLKAFTNLFIAASLADQVNFKELRQSDHVLTKLGENKSRKIAMLAKKAAAALRSQTSGRSTRRCYIGSAIQIRSISIFRIYTRSVLVRANNDVPASLIVNTVRSVRRRRPEPGPPRSSAHKSAAELNGPGPSSGLSQVVALLPIRVRRLTV